MSKNWDISKAQPPTLDHLIGNKRAVAQLRVTIDACFADGRPFPHTLFHGGKGTGKTTLCTIIAKEMGVTMVEVLGHNVTWSGDVNQILLDLDEAGMVAVDEIQTMPHSAQVALYRAMEEGKVFLDSTPFRAKPKVVQIPRFTLLAASTNVEGLLPPLRDRFQLVCELEPLSGIEIHAVLRQRADALHWTVEDEVLAMVAARTRGVPRLALRLFDSIYRTSRSEQAAAITKQHAMRTFELEGLVGDAGLSRLEHAYLAALYELGEEGSKPVRLHVLSSKLATPTGTLLQVVEPSLIREGFLRKFKDGRGLTTKAIEMLKAADPQIQ